MKKESGRVSELGYQERRRERERESMYVLYVLCVCMGECRGDGECENHREAAVIAPCGGRTFISVCVRERGEERGL